MRHTVAFMNSATRDRNVAVADLKEAKASEPDGRLQRNMGKVFVNAGGKARARLKHS